MIRLLMDLRVEMREARRRALTLLFNISSRFLAPSRNERSPKKGIDTYQDYQCRVLPQSRNERSPKKGIDTHHEEALQPFQYK